MEDVVEEGKDLIAETVAAFKTGLRGEEYVPGSGGSPELHQDEDLAKLDELRATGTLTDEAYTEARARLLGLQGPLDGQLPGEAHR